ncbi:MAG: glucose-1-phosphate adenylyltransferase [Ruminococcaceae bacterium]|nr:glucose-1-phosphate adenylyltransferase [Oscillospiraceae bacterium]
MFKKKECVAMLLAGGQGSRLYALTDKTAKPAVTFGGKYRIIDFPLSNCVNSGLDTVGVLTQYQPLVLNEYIGTGLPWDLDRNYGGVKILPPYQGKDGADWYKGTANAIYQNMQFIERYDAEYVLILSGDHIYHMDYAKMIDHHKKTGAACTIAVLDVTLEEASRFGIMSTHDDGTIYKFTEKPKNPDSTKASMGIYVFTRQKLFDYLIADAKDPDSANDFGKNIIPTMLGAGEKMMAYSFEGYWKDVGTIDSLWEANMDILGDDPVLKLNDGRWRVFSRHENAPPQYVGPNAVIENASITEGCEILGTVRNSVLGENVRVMEGAVVEDAVLMGDCIVHEGAHVSYAIIDRDVRICRGASVGKPRAAAKGIAVVGEGFVVEENGVIADGEIVSDKGGAQ